MYLRGYSGSIAGLKEHPSSIYPSSHTIGEQAVWVAFGRYEESGQERGGSSAGQEIESARPGLWVLRSSRS